VPRYQIPIIDIFAGPGGLSEGFSRFAEFTGGPISFHSRLAIEKDPVAARTLTLRSFFRQFSRAKVPDEFYKVIRQELPMASLEKFPEWKLAQSEVWNAELGAIRESDLHTKIARSLGGARDWVLLGGPPCQAYSLMGRARMTGVGSAARQAGRDVETLRSEKLTKFEADHRHELYREYLRIVAVHQPSVFVMENVKGILSSALPARDGKPRRRVFSQIRRDLSDPWSALSDDPKLETLKRFRKDRPHRYRLHSFTTAIPEAGAAVSDGDFLIRSEDHGVPQKRHRVIILGIRDDIECRPQLIRRSQKSTVSEAIGNLSPLRSGLSNEDRDEVTWRRSINEAVRQVKYPVTGYTGPNPLMRAFLRAEERGLTRGLPFSPRRGRKPKSKLEEWLTDSRIGGNIQHEARSHMALDLVRYLFVSATAQASGRSPMLEEWPPALLPRHRNVTVEKTTGKPKADGFSDRFKVQVWGEPASTVTSHIAKDGHYFIHPDPMQCRSLTVREAARLQTFPDNYFFCGNRTQQYHQIGNAVPPYLAVQLAGVVANLLRNSEKAGAK